MSKYTYILFFSVSCVLSVMMFFQIPDLLFYKVLMAVAAFSFEVGKIQLWIMWATTRNVIALLFSIMFIGMSLLASTSFIVSILDSQFNVKLVSNGKIDVWGSQVDSIESEINSLVEAMNNTPSEWITAKMRLSNRIAELRVSQSEMSVNRPIEEDSKSMSEVFYTLGKITKMDPRSFAVWFFIAFSVLLESGAVLLSPYKTPKVEKEEKRAELTKIKKLSKVYSVGLELFNEDGTIKSINDLSTKLDMSVRDIESIMEFFRRKGLLHTNSTGYVPVIARDEFLNKLRLLEA